MIKKNTEILAPAGSFEALETALRCGADAVYIGGKYFSARGNAQNFTNEEIAQACNLCHLYNAKLYIAVNTIISDYEAEDFCKYIKYTASLGADAYIVQDWGCLYLIKKCVPDAVLHASTQMTIHTPEGAEFAKSLGFSRIVPARELDRKSIEEISKHIPETEIFVHGALCMSVSGQCYFSSVIGTRSANRGVCGQACRLPFSSCGAKNCYALSLKDLSLLNHVKELKGIASSLKIEGRMKRPEYVASAVSETKKALSGQSPNLELLRSVFSRDGFTDGYFTGRQNHMFGIRLKDDVISARDLLPEIRKYYQKQPQLYSLSFEINIKQNQKITLLAYCPDYNISVTATGDIPEKALKKPVDMNFAEKQLSKLGDTIFRYSGVSGEIEQNLIVTASSLNSLRRQTVQEIQNKIINLNTPVYRITDYIPQTVPEKSSDKKPQIRIQCFNASQAIKYQSEADMLIIPLSECRKALELGADKNKICIAPPRFILNESKIITEIKSLRSMKINHLLCVNPAYIQIGKKLDMILHGGFGLNVTNSFSCRILADAGLDDITLSFEMKLSQLKKINSPVPTGIISYGRLPLMLVRNCPIKNETGCARCSKSIKDRTGRNFPVKCCGDYAEIFNSDILRLDEKEISGFDFIIAIPDDENFKKAVSYTKGLYYRGVINEAKNKKN